MAGAGPVGAVTRLDDIRQKYQYMKSGDPRVKPEKEPGKKKTRDALMDPQKPIFERNKKHIKKLLAVKSELEKVESKARMDAETIVVYPFDIETTRSDFTKVYFGKRREGKSFAMRWDLYCMRDQLPRGYVFTSTKINGYWQKFVPPRFVFDGYNRAVLAAIIEQQKQLIEYLGKHPDVVINPNIFLVLDDCVTEDLFHEPELNTIFFNGRHLRVFLLMSTQYAKRIPPGMRENVDQATIFRVHNLNQAEAICEGFLGHWRKEVAMRCLDENVWQDPETGERQFMVVDSSGNYPIDEMVRIGRAMDPDEIDFGWVMGCREYWGEEWDDATNKPKDLSIVSGLDSKS